MLHLRVWAKDGMVTSVIGYSFASVYVGFVAAWFAGRIGRAIDRQAFVIVGMALTLFTLLTLLLLGRAVRKRRTQEGLEPWGAVLWGNLEIALLIGGGATLLVRWFRPEVSFDALLSLGLGISLCLFVTLTGIGYWTSVE